MSYWLKKANNMGTTTIEGVDYTSVVGECVADTVSDLPPRIIGTKALAISSTCDIVNTGDKYEMDTYGNWHLQPKGVTLDLTGYYTSAQTDSAISAGVTAGINTLDAGLYDIDPDETVQWISETNGVIAVQKQDIQIATSQVTGLDTALNGAYPLTTWQEIPNSTDLLSLSVGRYVKVTGLNTLVNRPTGYTGGILLIVERIGTNSTPNGRRRITLYPISESFNTVSKYVILENATTPNTWGSWVRFDGGTVLS